MGVETIGHLKHLDAHGNTIDLKSEAYAEQSGRMEERAVKALRKLEGLKTQVATEAERQETFKGMSIQEKVALHYTGHDLDKEIIPEYMSTTFGDNVILEWREGSKVFWEKAFKGASLGNLGKNKDGSYAYMIGQYGVQLVAGVALVGASGILFVSGGLGAPILLPIITGASHVLTSTSVRDATGSIVVLVDDTWDRSNECIKIRDGRMLPVIQLVLHKNVRRKSHETAFVIVVRTLPTHVHLDVMPRIIINTLKFRRTLF